MFWSKNWLKSLQEIWQVLSWSLRFEVRSNFTFLWKLVKMTDSLHRVLFYLHLLPFSKTWFQSLDKAGCEMVLRKWCWQNYLMETPAAEVFRLKLKLLIVCNMLFFFHFSLNLLSSSCTTVTTVVPESCLLMQWRCSSYQINTTNKEKKLSPARSCSVTEGIEKVKPKLFFLNL